MNNKIIWTKWIDPFRKIVEKNVEEDENDINFISAHDSFQDETIQKRFLSSDDEAQDKTGPVVIGPFGIIPLQEHNLPGKLFNFWMGHTNFSITNKVKEIIQNVEGVETLDIYTRYRLRLGIAKAFNEKAVKKAIEAAVNPEPVAEKPKDKNENLKFLLKNKFKFWAIYTMADGRSQISGGDSIEAVKAKGYEKDAKEIFYSWQ